jgi:hypothetical protein
MTCKDCGKDGFTNPWQIRRHKESARGVAIATGARKKKHHDGGNAEVKPKRTYTRRARTATTTTVEAPRSNGHVEDPEAVLLTMVGKLYDRRLGECRPERRCSAWNRPQLPGFQSCRLGI